MPVLVCKSSRRPQPLARHMLQTPELTLLSWEHFMIAKMHCVNFRDKLVPACMT